MMKKANGEGSVHRYGDGWRGAVTLPDGRRVFRKARTKAEAITKIDTVKAQHAATGTAGDASTTVASFLTRWLEDTEPAVKPETMRRYRQHVEGHTAHRAARDHRRVQRGHHLRNRASVPPRARFADAARHQAVGS